MKKKIEPLDQIFVIDRSNRNRTKKQKLETLGHCELKRVLFEMRKQKFFGNNAVVLSLTFLSRKKMADLNWVFRKEREATDILSFEQPRSKQLRNFLFLGDLVVCTPVWLTQAEDQAHSAKAELAILLVHGLLHLLGFDHDQRNFRSMATFKRANNKMRKLEELLLNRLGISQKAGLIHRAKL